MQGFRARISGRFVFASCYLMFLIAEFASCPAAGQNWSAPKPTSNASMSPPLASSPLEVTPSPYSGSVGLNLPIAMPRALGRALPPISLTYNHQRGNGNAGVGWLIQSAAIIVDRKKGDDPELPKFLLSIGGSTIELVAIGDGLFRDRYDELRIEAREVASTDGALKWIVRDSVGTEFSFGATAESRVQVGTQPQTTVEWHLDRVEDLMHNYAIFRYLLDLGCAYPVEIQYSGNESSGIQPQNKVNLEYEERPHGDFEIAFRRGTALGSRLRLKTITVTSRNQQYSKLLFGYQQSDKTQRSLLVSVTRSSAAGDLPPTKFTYSDRKGVRLWSDVQAKGAFHLTTTTKDDCFVGDFDGDGRADLACAQDINGRWSLGLSRGADEHETAFKVSETTGPRVARSFDFNVAPLFKPKQLIAIPAVRATCVSGDFDGDNRLDIACLGADKRWSVGFGSSRGFRVAQFGDGPAVILDSSTAELQQHCLTGDFTGDGRTDIGCLVPGSGSDDGLHGSWSIAASTGTGWLTAQWDHGAEPKRSSSPNIALSCFSGDFNGDGKADILCYRNRWIISTSNGRGFDTKEWSNGPAVQFSSGQLSLGDRCIAGDFNGDGKTDVACYIGRAGKGDTIDGRWSVGLSTGTGWSVREWIGAPITDGDGVSNKCFAGDFNGDGKTDLTCQYPGSPCFARISPRACWSQSIATGDGFRSSLVPFETAGVIGPGFYNYYIGCTGADFNGDGKTDFYCVGEHESDGYRFTLSDRDGSPVDVITSATDSLGIQQTFDWEYAFALSRSANPTDENLLGFPLILLRRLRTTNGQQTTEETYRYLGGRYLKTIREFRGFRTVVVRHGGTPNSAPLVQTMRYHQGSAMREVPDEPIDTPGLTAGRLSSLSQEDDSGRLLAKLSFEFDTFPAPGGSVARVRRTLDSYGMSSTQGKESLFEYDKRGNVLSITERDIDAPAKAVERSWTYAEEHGDHAIANVLSAETRDVMFGRVRSVTLEYDGLACGKASPAGRHQVTAIGSTVGTSVAAIRHFQHDDVGNVVCAADEDGAQTLLTYDLSGEHLLSSTNPLGQRSELFYYGVGSEPDGQKPGLLKRVVNPSKDEVAHYEYDAFGRVTRSIEAGVEKRMAYLDFGKSDAQRIVTQSGDLRSVEFIDGAGRVYKLRSTGAEGFDVLRDYTYSRAGSLESVSRAVAIPSNSPDLQ